MRTGNLWDRERVQLGQETASDSSASIKSSLAAVDHLVDTLRRKANEEETCRATLYVNFVDRTTAGVNIPKIDADNYTTHTLMLRVVQELVDQAKADEQ